MHDDKPLPEAGKCKRCARLVPHVWNGLCARCYLHAGGV